MSVPAWRPRAWTFPGRALRRPRALPGLGPLVPAIALPLGTGLLGAALVLGQVPSPFLAPALLLPLVLAVRPSAGAAGALILVLAATRAGQPLLPVRPGLFVLLAGIHLLHVLTALCGAVPRRGWLQLAALRRPLLRFAAVQVPVQGVALVVLSLVPGRSGGLAALPVPALGAVGAGALGAAVLLLVRPLLRRPPR